jgi:hypothetical protein
MFKSFKSRILYSLLAVGILASSGAAQAVTTTYDFGNLLTSSGPVPTSFGSTPFAQLAATDTGGGVWTFMLSVKNNLFSSFGSDAFIGSMSFDFTPDPYGYPQSRFISSNRGGVTSVASTNGTGNSGLTDIDFGTQFGRGSNNRLSENDWVKWSVSGLRIGSTLTNMYIMVQGITYDIGYCLNGGYSAKYTPITTPVPEPETYAMILAGLGLIGFTARRRKRNT